MGVCRVSLKKIITLPRRAANAYGSNSTIGSLQAKDNRVLSFIQKQKNINFVTLWPHAELPHPCFFFVFVLFFLILFLVL